MLNAPNCAAARSKASQTVDGVSLSAFLRLTQPSLVVNSQHMSSVVGERRTVSATCSRSGSVFLR